MTRFSEVNCRHSAQAGHPAFHRHPCIFGLVDLLVDGAKASPNHINPRLPENGYVTPPDSPGWGAEWHLDYFHKKTVEVL